MVRFLAICFSDLPFKSITPKEKSNATHPESDISIGPARLNFEVIAVITVVAMFQNIGK